MMTHFKKAGVVARAERVQTPVSRRSMLGRLSASALCLTLPVWRRFEAQAQTSSARRFIALFTANGTIAEQFFPPAGADPTSSTILAPLADFKDQLMVLRGVHLNSAVGEEKPGGPHMKHPGALLTGGWLLEGNFKGAGGPAGLANRISVDQTLANHLGENTAFRSLEFGIAMRGQEPLRHISYRGANQPNPAVDDPWSMHERIFGNFVPDDAAREQLISERQTVLDYVKDELGHVGARLPSEDRQRLDAHLTHIRGIEKRLHSLAPCEPSALGERIDSRATDNYPQIAKLQLDLMFQAHACDLTRVSSLMFANANSWQKYPWLNIQDEHHELSHQQDEESLRKLVEINIWQMEQFAYFFGLLASVPEGDSNMLDSSVILCGNELGEGRDHTHTDVPWLLAGTGGGHFASGRSLQFADQPHNNLLLSMLHAFGMESENSFGAPEYCTGPLDGLRA